MAPRNAFTRFGATPKHFLADPALAARLLGLDEQRLLNSNGTSIGPNDKTRLGSLFEALVGLSLRACAQAAEATVIYTGEYAYRRADGIAVIPLSLLGV